MAGVASWLERRLGVWFGGGREILPAVGNDSIGLRLQRIITLVGRNGVVLATGLEEAVAEVLAKTAGLAADGSTGLGQRVQKDHSVGKAAGVGVAIDIAAVVMVTLREVAGPAAWWHSFRLCCSRAAVTGRQRCEGRGTAPRAKTERVAVGQLWTLAHGDCRQQGCV